MPASLRHVRLTEPSRCVIRVRGTLASTWSPRMGDMRIAHATENNEPITELTGQLADEAALHGVLNTLYELRFPLLGVQCSAAHDGRSATNRRTAS